MLAGVRSSHCCTSVFCIHVNTTISCCENSLDRASQNKVLRKSVKLSSAQAASPSRQPLLGTPYGSASSINQTTSRVSKSRWARLRIFDNSPQNTWPDQRPNMVKKKKSSLTYFDVSRRKNYLDTSKSSIH